MSTILTAQALSHAFGTRLVLGGVSLSVGARDRIGLVGINGSGKSTLLRILVGETVPDDGVVTRRRDLIIQYVPQEPRLDPDRTVGETVAGGARAHTETLVRFDAVSEEIAGLEGQGLEAALKAQATLHERIEALGGWDRGHAVRGITTALGLREQGALVGTLSIGERRRVALARALLERPELLVLDEPTNHLDAAIIEWLEKELCAQPGALVLVTHDRYFLDRVATRIIELDRGELWAYEGNYTRFLERQAERLEHAAALDRERASFVRRELQWIRRGPKARGTKQQARIARFDDVVAQGEVSAARGPHTRRMSLRLPSGARLGKTILELKGLSKSMAGKKLFSELGLVVKPKDRLGVVGPNGAGKTTLVRVILGEIAPDSGEVIVGQNTRLAFLDQARAELHDDRTVLEEVSGDSDFVALDCGPVPVRTFLRMLLFDDGFAETPVGALSGGERSRVQLAKLLRAGGNFLVLDEPTNDLDLVTLGVLEQALEDFPGCALVVSHDRWFLDRVATAILAFEGDGRVTLHEGDYSAWAAKRAADKPEAAAEPRPRTERHSQARPRRRTYKEREEIAGIEEAIVSAEARVAELEATLSDPSLYRDRVREVPSITSALATARVEVERLYARWQELDGIPP